MSDYEEELVSPPPNDFVSRYGEVKVKYIPSPPIKKWFFNRPYAHNYFHDGTLYRTSEERSESSKTELFLDLLYVGIVAKLASDATEETNGSSLLRYCLLFCPIWQIWSDVQDLVNYYFTEDLGQKLYILWILALLVIYTNSTNYLLESNGANAYVILPYVICRLSMSISLIGIAIYVPQHRKQNILYGCLIIITCCIWIPVIFVSTRVKIALTVLNLILENAGYIIAYHPKTKELLHLTHSTAVNIEHTVERIGAFYIIAIGEFTYSAVATSAEENFGMGLTSQLFRAIMLVVISFLFLWLYFNGDGSFCAVHAVRRSATTAYIWMLSHAPLIASLVLAADAAADMCYEEEYASSGLTHYFTGGLALALVALLIQAWSDKTLDEQPDPVKEHRAPKFYRLLPRLPVSAIIFALGWSSLTITELFGTIMALLVAMAVYEIFAMGEKCY